MIFRRKYGVLLVTGTTALRFPMVTWGTTDLEGGSVWTPAPGDVKIGKDGAALDNVTNLPTYNDGAWDLVLTATELECKNAVIRLIDQTNPKVIEDQFLLVETFGHASAMDPHDPADIVLIKKLLANRMVVDPDGLEQIHYDDDDTTPILTFDLTAFEGGGFSERTPQ